MAGSYRRSRIVLLSLLAFFSAASVACGPTIRASNLSDSPSVVSSGPRIVGSGGENGWLYMTWLEGTDVTFVTREMASQATVSAAVDLGPAQGTGAVLTGVEMAAAYPNVHVAIPHWASGGSPDIYVASSNDNGATFLPRVNASNSANPSQMPSVAATGDRVFVAWRESVGTADHILLAESADGGATYTAPVTLTTDGADDIRPAITIAGDHVYVLYCTSAAKTAVRKRSLDATGFQPEEILNPAGNTQPCGNERIASSGSTAVASWTGDGRVFVASSTAGSPFSGTMSVPTTVPDPSTNVSVVGLQVLSPTRFHIAFVVDDVYLEVATSSDGSTLVRQGVPTGLLTPVTPRLASAYDPQFLHLVWAQPPGDQANDLGLFRSISQDYGETFSDFSPVLGSEPDGEPLPGFLPDVLVRGSDRYIVWRRNLSNGRSDIWFHLWRHYRFPWETQ